jgi:uncharacterized ion transporter superfamily protein YfcC
MSKRKFRWFIPHPTVILFSILLFAGVMSYVVPAGSFSREMVDGRERVIPGSFQELESTPLGLMDLFVSIPLGFRSAIDIIFIVLASGIMFGFMNHSRSIENSVAVFVKRLGVERRYLIVIVMTFLFGSLGVFVGYENNIAMIPIAALLSLALGGDLILAAGISVAAITIGFGLSPVNPYTVGVGHKLAELPLFSGALLRTALTMGGLSILAWYNVRYLKRIIEQPQKSLGIGLVSDGLHLSKPIDQYHMSSRDAWVIGIFAIGILIILYGVFELNWFINQISAIFCMMAIVIGLMHRYTMQEFGEITLKSVAEVAPGAFMVGLAASIRIAMETAQISDTIAYYLSDSLKHLPLVLSAVTMTVAQSFMNFMIPSGSGQALATLPVMLPIGEVLGITRQSVVLAFQVGDGITNLINPALGGLVAMLAMCRVPFDRWLRFIIWPYLLIYLLALIGVVCSVLFDYGPF